MAIANILDKDTDTEYFYFRLFKFNMYEIHKSEEIL